jgi:hypothetical protein
MHHLSIKEHADRSFTPSPIFLPLTLLSLYPFVYKAKTARHIRIVILFQDRGRHLPKLKYDLRRNASTHVRKTDIKNPSIRFMFVTFQYYCICWRFMFVTFQYYCICWMSKLPRLKIKHHKFMMADLNMLSWQDSETRPGEFVIFNAIHYSNSGHVCWSNGTKLMFFIEDLT